MTIIKNQSDLDDMRLACQGAAKVLDFITPYVQEGITTAELDKLCLEYITETLKAKSATIGYGNPPFPSSICTSINHQVCHGIPSNKKLKKGDILNIDVTIIKNGWFGDTSRMFYVGEVSILAKHLSMISYECMWKGIEKVKNGAYLGDIGHAIQQHAEKSGFSVVREFCGHGLGKNFHEEPQVLHYGTPKTQMKIFTGLLFTIEPMINAGKKEISHLNDGWTVITKDRSLSAQWEHAILVKDSGCEVLTISANMPKIPNFISSNKNITFSSLL
ncbi:Methionine aminopeptidase [Candidatus Kinetoplastibacterium sorsogonicusi]|uniref:Methionine aminopeptidase n=1 Tax=Candidatus Kinetoplastidibacterium kentomonadis TaxID=1576550 RepID=A0A3Q8EY53_9PROT|nr:type I methionyl aminopeptidase [Candidatus Kinetoplastibacterium sorsogonicusi]AWD32423.1 Methionine aminopeptidase [Candidatus Kinetoplastibacterium sorsogonicusi]